jgi:hypothetical protein
MFNITAYIIVSVLKVEEDGNQYFPPKQVRLSTTRRHNHNMNPHRCEHLKIQFLVHQNVF